MKIILHIGSEKTGSTSIQSVLWSDRERLRDEGILVPNWSHPVLKGHVIKALFKGVEDTRIDHRGAFYQGDEAALTFAWEEWESAEKEVLKFKPHTLVLSTELLFSPLCDEAIAIVERLKRISTSIEVVVYLRNPKSFVISSASQEFKNKVALSTKSLGEKLAYQQVISSYERMFDEPVRVFEYDRRKLAGGSIVEDFFTKVLKTTLSEQLSRTEWNVSPSPEMVSILQDLYVKLTKTQNWNLGPYDFRLLARLLATDKRHPSKPKTLTPMVESWIGRKFKDREWLQDKSGISFDRDTTDHATPQIDPPDEMRIEDVFVLDQSRQEALRDDLRQRQTDIWQMLQNSIQGSYYRCKHKVNVRLRLYKSRVAQFKKQ